MISYPTTRSSSAPAASLPAPLVKALDLLQSASPVTKDGKPTVAAQLAGQAISQAMPGGISALTGAPPTPQPGMGMGAPAMSPQPSGTVPQAAQMAGIAAQQQAQDQQAGLQFAAQMAKQQQLSGGIAALPADNLASMDKYAHGGVIGFSDGGAEAEKKRPPEPDPAAVAKAATSAGIPGAAGIVNLLNQFQRPDPAAAVQQAKQMMPSEDLDKIRATTEELYKAQSEAPPAQQYLLDAYKKAQEQREALRKDQESRAGFDRAMAYFGGLGQGGLGGAGLNYQKFKAAEDARRAGWIGEDEAQAAKISSILEAQNNQKLAALTGKLDRMTKTAETQTHRLSAIGKLAGDIVSSQGSFTGQQLHTLAALGAANISAASSAKSHELQREYNMLIKASELLTRQEQNATRHFATRGAEIQKLDDALNKKYAMDFMRQANPEAAKDPNHISRMTQYAKERADRLAEIIGPLDADYARSQAGIAAQLERMNAATGKIGNSLPYGPPPKGAVQRVN